MRRAIASLLPILVSTALVSCFDFESSFSRQSFRELGAFTEAKQAYHVQLSVEDYSVLLEIFSAFNDEFNSSDILDTSPAEFQEGVVAFCALMAVGLAFADGLDEIDDEVGEFMALAERIAAVWEIDWDSLWSGLGNLDNWDW